MSNDQEPQGPTPRRRRHGPIYDDAMKILADYDFAALLSIVGVGGELTRLNAELTPSATRPNLLARTPAGIVHLEFVKVPTRDLGLRMADYQLRLLREYPDVPLTQYVLALGESSCPTVSTTPAS